MADLFLKKLQEKQRLKEEAKKARLAKKAQPKAVNLAKVPKAVKTATKAMTKIPAEQQVVLLQTQLEAKETVIEGTVRTYEATIANLVEQFNKALVLYANNEDKLNKLYASIGTGSKAVYLIVFVIGFLLGGLAVYLNSTGVL